MIPRLAKTIQVEIRIKDDIINISLDITSPNIKNTKNKIKNKKLKINGITKGKVEKAIIHSIEYKNHFQKDHLVSPAALSTFSYSNHFVLNPIQPKIPLENLLYS